MLTVYIVSTLVALVLILLSLFGAGHHDADASADVGPDVGADAGGLDHDAATDGHDVASGWLTFLSLRFWTYFAASFGLVGLILSFTGLAPGLPGAFISAGAGLLTGALVVRFLALARQMAGDTAQGVNDLMGSTGRVLVGASGVEPGKIRCSIKGDSIDLIALSHDGQPIAAGEEVVVLSIDGTRATVARKAELFGGDSPG